MRKIIGKKNGKGIEYDENGDIIFEGEYLYDYKIKGKEYCKKKLIYEVEEKKALTTTQTKDETKEEHE